MNQCTRVNVLSAGKVKSGNITFLKIPTAIILFETKQHNLDISSTQLTKVAQEI